MSMKGKALVGLDVHAAQTHAAVLDTLSGEVRVKRLVCPPLEVVTFLEGSAAVCERCTRRARPASGWHERLVSAGSTLASSLPGRSRRGRLITSRRIGGTRSRLARLLAAGELRFAFVPSVADEQFRDLTRSIEDVRGDLMRARHRLSKFLLRRGERYGGPGRAWTASPSSLAAGTPVRGSLLARQLRRLPGRDRTAARPPRQPARGTRTGGARVEPRGRDCTAALLPRHRHALCGWRSRAEIGDFSRFPKPALLSGFLGIVPSERTSDQKRRQGAITKAGPTHARRLLVEAAHHYGRRPFVGAVLARRQQGADPRVIAVAWRAQQRLYQRWQRLREQRRKPAGVVAVACARELATFLWEAAILD